MDMVLPIPRFIIGQVGPLTTYAIDMVLPIPNFITCQIPYCTLKYEVQKGCFLPVHWGPTTPKESSFRKDKDPPPAKALLSKGQWPIPPRTNTRTYMQKYRVLHPNPKAHWIGDASHFLAL